MDNSATNLQNKIPPVWSYNPSERLQRLPLLIISVIGFLIALYLGLYQLHVFSNVWEPFFGNDAKGVLTSFVSHSLPVPDALLGAAGYLADIVLASVGNESRWHTHPCLVILYASVVCLMGVGSMLLVILQPVVLQAWCTLCLTSAFISIIMISPATDELLASLQFLQRVKKSENSLWKAFWGVRNYK